MCIWLNVKNDSISFILILLRSFCFLHLRGYFFNFQQYIEIIRNHQNEIYDHTEKVGRELHDELNDRLNDERNSKFITASHRAGMIEFLIEVCIK